MPQLTEPRNLPPAPFTEADRVLRDTTLRQTIHVSVGGRQLRQRFSNAFGGAALPLINAVVALPAQGRAGVSAVEPGSTRRLTFSGRPATVLPTGRPGDPGVRRHHHAVRRQQRLRRPGRAPGVRRQTVNRWIRTSGRFDGVVDFDRVALHPQRPQALLPAYDVGDHLHLNPVGYQALADAVPARWFRDRATGATALQE